MLGGSSELYYWAALMLDAGINMTNVISFRLETRLILVESVMETEITKESLGR